MVMIALIDPAGWTVRTAHMGRVCEDVTMSLLFHGFNFGQIEQSSAGGEFPAQNPQSQQMWTWRYQNLVSSGGRLVTSNDTPQVWAAAAHRAPHRAAQRAQS